MEVIRGGLGVVGQDTVFCLGGINRAKEIEDQGS